MPYFLSKPMSESVPPLWREGAPYQRQVVYDGCGPDSNPASPPVHYDSHLLKPHSLTHADAPSHVIHNGKTIDHFFNSDSRPSSLWGKATVIQFDMSDFTPCSEVGYEDHFIFRVSKEKLIQKLFNLTGSALPPSRLLISASAIPTHPHIGHDPKWILVLEEAAAEWLISHPNFVTFGTSWKSTDFNPTSRDRPIHTILFRSALIFECLDLMEVPEGDYFFVGIPLRIEGASESPVCPILLKKEELAWAD